MCVTQNCQHENIFVLKKDRRVAPLQFEKIQEQLFACARKPGKAIHLEVNTVSSYNPTMNKLNIYLLLLLICLFSALPCQAGDVEFTPSGKYAVQGWEPDATTGPPSYAGTAKIWQINEAYLFEADMDGQRYTGVALFDAQSGILAIQFNGTDGDGLTMLKHTDGKLEGAWVYGEMPSKTGREIWTRIK